MQLNKSFCFHNIYITRTWHYC